MSLYRGYFVPDSTDPFGTRKKPRARGISRCTELYGDNIAHVINDTILDEAIDRRNRRQDATRVKKNPKNQTARDKFHGHEGERQVACRKLGKIIDCLSEIHGPFPPDVKEALDHAQQIFEGVCKTPPPPLPPIPVPELDPQPKPVGPLRFRFDRKWCDPAPEYPWWLDPYHGPFAPGGPFTIPQIF